MIAHAWSVLAERSLIDRDTNNISLDVLERIALSDPLPAEQVLLIPFRFEIVSFWYRRDMQVPARGTARIRHLGSNDDQLSQDEIDLDLFTYPRLRTRIGFLGLPVTSIGIHFFVVDLRDGETWIEVARVPLEIAPATPPDGR